MQITHAHTKHTVTSISWIASSSFVYCPTLMKTLTLLLVLMHAGLFELVEQIDF